MSKTFEYSVVSLLRVRPFVRNIAVTVFLLVLLFIIFLFLPWEQTIIGEGKLIAFKPTERHYTIKAPHTGFIKQYWVTENQHVIKGDPICMMTDQDQDFKTRLDDKEQRIIHQIEQMNSERQSLTLEQAELLRDYQVGLAQFVTRIANLKKSVETLQLKHDAAQQEYVTKKMRFERVKKLFKRGLESKQVLEINQNLATQSRINVEQAKLAVDMQNEQLSIAKQEKIRFSAKQTIIRQKSLQRMAALNRALENYEKEKLDLESKISRYANTIVHADKNGTVLRLLHNDTNRLIQKGEDIIHFVPDVTVRSIYARVSDFDMPLLKKDLPVRIRFYGWPSMQISGWPKITFGTFSGYVYVVESISSQEGSCYLHVLEDPNAPWPDSEVLKLGSSASLWIRLDTVPIWYQIWRRLNAMPPNRPEQTTSTVSRIK